MKSIRFTSVSVRVAVGLLAVVFMAGVAQAQALKVEAKLIWGTNDPQSPDPKHKPVEGHLARQLSKSPYRWKYYYEVNKVEVDVPVSVTKSNVPISKQCKLDIKNMGSNQVEVTLHGNGKRVIQHKESLAHGWQLILGGDSANDTAWLVVIKKVEPAAPKLEKPVATTAPPSSDPK